jgi:hypothetical protein
LRDGGANFQVWSDNLSGRPTQHLYLLAFAFKVFDPSVASPRGISALGRALAVALTFLAIREVTGSRVTWMPPSWR